MYSYLFVLSALPFAPHGIDLNSYKIGRGKYNPSRIFRFVITMCQQLLLIYYSKTYFLKIASYLTKCKQLSIDTDLNSLQYHELRRDSLKKIISKSNRKKLQQLKTIQQTNDGKQDKKQISPNEMISLLNIHYDKNDPLQYANIFLPPSLSLDINYTASFTTNGRYNNTKKIGPPTPAVIFFVGGAWGSCDVSFCASAASSFLSVADKKIAFIYAKYKVYPKGDVNDMLNNMNAIIEWTIKFSSVLNINPNHIGIVGQSSGAHLSSLAIMKAYQKKSKWLRRVRLYCGLAGPYDISDHYEHESSRGIEHVSPMARCMRGSKNFALYSPSCVANDIFEGIGSKYGDNKQHDINYKLKQCGSIFPFMLLIHSIYDYVVPISSSIKYYNALKRLHIDVELLRYKNGTHYDALFGLCDPKNCLFDTLINDITSRLFRLCKEYDKYPRSKYIRFDKEKKITNNHQKQFDEKQNVQQIKENRQNEANEEENDKNQHDETKNTDKEQEVDKDENKEESEPKHSSSSDDATSTTVSDNDDIDTKEKEAELAKQDEMMYAMEEKIEQMYEEIIQPENNGNDRAKIDDDIEKYMFERYGNERDSDHDTDDSDDSDIDNKNDNIDINISNEKTPIDNNDDDTQLTHEGDTDSDSYDYSDLSKYSDDSDDSNSSDDDEETDDYKPHKNGIRLSDNKNKKVTTANGLFGFSDISVSNNTDDLVKFMKHLVSDMDHALNKVTTTTKGEMNIMTEQ